MCRPCPSLQEHLNCDKVLAAQSQSGATNVAVPEPWVSMRKAKHPPAILSLHSLLRATQELLPVASEKL